MRITDELREYAQSWRETPNLMDELDAGDIDGLLGDFEHIADRIDEAHERELRETGEDIVRDVRREWVRLPVDADGVPIRVGDVMDGTCPSGKHVNGTVSAIGDGVFWLSNVQFYLKPDYMHHYHAPTVEDVLREFAQEMNENLGMYTGEAIDADEWRDADNKTIAEYAKRLRLAGGEGE